MNNLEQHVCSFELAKQPGRLPKVFKDILMQVNETGKPLCSLCHKQIDSIESMLLSPAHAEDPVLLHEACYEIILDDY